jgi:hypothetical protein
VGNRTLVQNANGRLIAFSYRVDIS